MTIRIGSFFKTCSPHIVEIMAFTGLDFGILDAEHAPFDRFGLDLMLLAGRAAHLPLYIRVADHQPATIQHSLDLAPLGLVVPHVDSPAQALDILKRARFIHGERGYSNAARFGSYGTTTMEEAIAIGDAAEIICQIESPAAVANADAIAAISGVSGLLVGRADLAISLGLRSVESKPVLEGARTVIAAARRHNKMATIVIAGPKEMPAWLALGADNFVVGSDQSLLRMAFTSMVAEARTSVAGAPLPQ